MLETPENSDQDLLDTLATKAKRIDTLLQTLRTKVASEPNKQHTLPQELVNLMVEADVLLGQLGLPESYRNELTQLQELFGSYETIH